MNIRISLYVALLAAALVRTAGAGITDPASIIIKYRSGYGTALSKNTASDDRVDGMRSRHGLGVRKAVFTRPASPLAKAATDTWGLDRVYTLALPDTADLNAVLADLEATGELEYVQPNRRYATHAVPDDEDYGMQWALPAVHAPEAWDTETGDATVVIGIIDTGIDYDHEDLRDNIWTNEAELNGTPGVDDDGNGYVDDVRGWDFTDAPGYGGGGDYLDRDNDPDDDVGHGTHVAGIAAAVGDNGTGIAGLAWNCRLMAVRAGFGGGGFGSGLLEDDDIAAALVYAADNGADVINMSFGDPFLSYVVRDAVRYAYAKGCVMTASTGNSGVAQLAYPARFSETVAVGNVNQSGLLASSNYGENIDVVAPGTNIISTVPPDSAYGYKNGTSMAAPLVAGLAGLILSHTPGLDPEAVRGILRASADDLGTTGYDRYYGAGRVNAEQALMLRAATVLRIAEPVAGSGIRAGTDIVYSAYGPALAEHRIEYGFGTAPYEWTPIAGPGYGQAFDDTVFFDAAALPETTITVRIIGTETNGTEREYRIPLFIDRTAPGIDTLSHGPRLDGGAYTYAFVWETDENTTGTVRFRPAGSDGWRTVTDNYAYVRHAVPLGSLAPGTYDFIVRVDDRAGLADSLTGTFGMPAHTDVPPLPHTMLQHLPDAYAAPEAVDFDHDGLHEAVLMLRTDASYGPVYAYERDGDTLAPGTALRLYTDGDSVEAFLPVAAGDFNGDGNDELLCDLVDDGFDCSFIAASRVPGTRPDTVTASLPGFARFVTDTATDLDGDAQREAVLFSYGSMTVYESPAATGAWFLAGTAPYPSGASGTWAELAAAGDVMGTGTVQVFGAGTDGRVLAVRDITGSPQVIPVDTVSFPNGAVLLACTDDLDGNGRAELFVAGPVRVDDPYEDPDDYWALVLYEYEGAAWHAVWRDCALGVTDGTISFSSSGARIADMNGDGTNELVLSIHPGFYVVSARGPGLFYAAHHLDLPRKSGVPFTGTGTLARTMLVPADDRLDLLALPGGIPELDFPAGFTAYPLDTARARLAWRPAGGGTYTLYRGPYRDSLQTLVTVSGDTAYTDTGLTTYRPYWYAVTAGGSLYTARAQRVVPNPPPAADSAVAASGGTHITLYLNEPPDPLSVNPGNFTVDGSRTPSSALVPGNRTVVLGFIPPLAAGRTCTLAMAGVTDTMGTPAALRRMAVSVPALAAAPRIDSVRYVTSREVTVYFSGPVLSDSLRNAHIRFDPAVMTNTITTDSSADSCITVRTAAAIDLSGNTYTLYADTVYWQDDSGRVRMSTGLSAPVLAGAAPTDFSRMLVYPNPYNAAKYSTGKIVFADIPSHIVLRVYTAAGTLVRTLENEFTGSFAAWELDNDAGKKVASGLYYYYIESYDSNGATRSKMGKIAIIR